MIFHRTTRGLLAVVFVLGAGRGFSADKASFKTDDEKAAYIMGHQTGANFKRNGVELNVDAFLAGVKDGLKGVDSAFDQAESQKVMEGFQKKVTENREALQEKEGKANAEEGKAFLEANKKKEGVKVAESGLQYKILKEGTGPKPGPSDTVTTHYKGTLINGKVFDSSYDRGQPATFPVGGVIKGWTEALQMMPTGSKWQLFIPAELGYGSRGAGADIGPEATLIFEVELLSVKGQDKPEAEKK